MQVIWMVHTRDSYTRQSSVVRYEDPERRRRLAAVARTGATRGRSIRGSATRVSSVCRRRCSSSSSAARRGIRGPAERTTTPTSPYPCSPSRGKTRTRSPPPTHITTDTVRGFVVAWIDLQYSTRAVEESVHFTPSTQPELARMLTFGKKKAPRWFR